MAKRREHEEVSAYVLHRKEIPTVVCAGKMRQESPRKVGVWDAARILLIGNHTEAETVLACLVGAGVGQIDLCKTAILA